MQGTRNTLVLCRIDGTSLADSTKKAAVSFIVTHRVYLACVPHLKAFLEYSSVPAAAGGGRELDNFTFGWTMTVIGMGVTFITLLLLSLVIGLLNRVFPFKEEDPKQ